MANDVISTAQTSTYTLAPLDRIYIIQSGSVTVTSGPALTNTGMGTDISLQIDGNVTTLDASDAIRLEDTSGNFRVKIGATGSVTSMQGGAVTISGPGTIFQNFGTIIGATSGVTQTNTTASGSISFLNAGTISGQEGVGFGGGGSGALGVNTGEIFGESIALRLAMVSGSFSNAGLLSSLDIGAYLFGGISQDFTNSGTISALGSGIFFAEPDARIINTGTITAGASGILSLANNFFNNSVLLNRGTITADEMGISTSGSTLRITSTGIIDAGTTGVLVNGNSVKVNLDGHITAGGTGVQVTGTSALLDLSGIVQASGFYGLRVTGTESKISQSGRVTAEDTAMDVSGGGTVIDNSGTVRGRFEGLHLEMSGTSIATVDNSGVLAGGLYGLFIDAGRLVLSNTGLITGRSEAILTFNAANIVNYGEIRTISNPYAIRSYGSDGDILRNFGTIAGGVNLFKADDTFRNAGLVDSFVLLGTGNDLYNGRSGRAEGIIQGEGGNDTLIGGANEDALQGGTGSDLLTGGAGADRFIFASAAEVSVIAGSAGADRITDFQSGTDKIDLATFMRGAVFLGSGAFTTTGTAPQMRYDAPSGTLLGDVNGNGTTDWVLLLQNRPAFLQATDFLL